ncbi:DNA polymerase III subunit chi [Polaromonas sp. CG_9.11]|uniref:DNA polymerase III subunit chi n=1 Tax=Polaromonas sp. CG_9.11 TaxID=2787730 RepID=UPI0018CBA661|nr:DNA polymerase III subunit chi [Polaromonas sp. CG_9.11]MBG6076293.1 DNA polymerase-3 subunit chi [Polaromonas sp. CG_9.11]
MTDIAFHFNAADKLAYGCRLLRKIYLRGAKVAVTAEPALLDQLDTLLWTFSAADFVPHCTAAAATPATLAFTPVVLAVSPAGYSEHGILVNLGLDLPAGFEGYDRLIEVVSLLPEDAQAGRSRWKHYAARGYSLKRHDLAQWATGTT